MIAIHFNVWTVAQEKGGFSARCHLGTMGTSVAAVGRGSFLTLWFGGDCLQRCGAAGILAIPVHAQPHQNEKRNDPPEKARSFFAAIGRRSPGRGCPHNSWPLRTKEVFRSFLSVVVGFNFKGECFSERWANPIFRERGDMDKNLLTTLGGRDEPESPVVIPLCECAFDAHWIV